MKFVKLIKSKQWIITINASKEMQALHNYVDEGNTIDMQYEKLVKNFCQKLHTYEDEIKTKIGDYEADEFNAIIDELEIVGGDSIDGFDEELNDLYDFCDRNSIWLETRNLSK